MMDAANLLRAYNAALHEAIWIGGLASASAAFFEENRPRKADPVWAHLSAIRRAHESRVRGTGSPTACDEALARAIKEIAHG